MSTVGSFGERLRREREMRGVSLDDIAEATKIGTRLLRALEEEHFELLPGGIFNKGFVRAYAKYLGLNEDEAVEDYLAAAGESSPDPRLIAEQNSTRIDRTGLDVGAGRSTGFPILPVLILLLVIAAGAGGWQIYKDRQRERQAKAEAARAASVNAITPNSKAQETSPQAMPTSPTAQPTDSTGMPASPPSGVNSQVTKSAQTTPPSGVPTDLNSQPRASEAATRQESNPSTDIKPNVPPPDAAESSALGATAANVQPFEVSVRAVDSAWVSIKSDGKFMVRGIIGPSDVKTVHATDQVVFYTGNAGAVEVSFNGRRVALAGGPNSEGVLIFNSRGVVIPRPGVPNVPSHQP